MVFIRQDRSGKAVDRQQVSQMKQQLPLIPFPTPQPETGRIYFAIVIGGAAILLMILAEMKFFGT
jgi:hypothetical protein